MTRWAGRQTTALVAACLAEHGDMCHLCGRAGATTADHLIPRSAGGDNSLANLRPAHRSCNSIRQAMPLEEWRRRHPIRRPSAAPSRRW